MMLNINLEIPLKIVGGYLVAYGKTIYNGQNIKVNCHISQSFLEDIANGRTEYFQIFKDNIWSIEMLAENKLSSNRDIERLDYGVKITIFAADKAEFDNLN